MKTKHTPEPWSLLEKIARYNLAGKDALALKSAGLPTSFDAISIGTQDGQIALIPLDESNKENGERIVACVNACAGLNPEAVPELLKCARIQRGRLKGLIQMSESNPNSDTRFLKADLNRVDAAIKKAKS